MAKVIMVCGKLCSGKTTYINKLKREHKAVLLSCDEITLTFFDGNLGDKHDMITERVKNYLYQKSVEVVEAGADVILDWGFWKRSWRDHAREFYRSRNIPFEFHYIVISDEMWKANIAKRNKSVERGDTSAYYVDEGLIQKNNLLFEEPSDEETDIWYINVRR